MTRHDIDTEALALSNQLFDLADSFLQEARLWLAPAARDELTRTAQLLAEIARATLRRHADLQVADSFAEAGLELIQHITATRRFLTGLGGIQTVAAAKR